MTAAPPDPKEQKQQSAGRHDPLGRLDRDLEAFEERRRKAPSAMGVGGAAGEGYRVLGQMLGGVLGGVGLGWLVDQLAHTSPWGLVGGLVIGTGLSIYSTVQTASRFGAKAKSQPTAVQPPPVDEDDEA